MYRFKKLHLLFFVIAASTFFSCNATKISTTDNSEVIIKASTMKTATVVHSTKEENNWIKTNFPGAQVYEKELIYDKPNYYDIVRFKTKKGDNFEAYFNVTSFYGK